MNGFLSSAAVALNPVIGLVITVAGALIGGKLAGDAPLGMLLGLVAGSAVAISLCGAVALLATVVAAIEQPAAAQSAAADPMVDQAAIRAAALQAANGHAGGSNGATAASAEDEQLGHLLARGEFSQYHLHKARQALVDKRFKDAAYQAAASLAHDPGNAEAKSIRASAKGA